MCKRSGVWGFFLFSFPNTELTMYLRNLLFFPTVKPLSFLRLKQSLYQLDYQIPSYVFLKTPLNLVLSIARRSLASPQQMHAHNITALLREDSHPLGQPHSIWQQVKTTRRVVLAEASKGSLHPHLQPSPTLVAGGYLWANSKSMRCCALKSCHCFQGHHKKQALAEPSLRKYTQVWVCTQRTQVRFYVRTQQF